MKTATYTEGQRDQEIKNIQGIIQELETAAEAGLFNIHIDLDAWYVRGFDNEKDLTDFIVAETDDSDNAVVIYNAAERDETLKKLSQMEATMVQRSNPDSHLWLINYEDFSVKEYESENQLARAEYPSKEALGAER